MKYIVTGGAGFIGSHLIEKLLSEKHKVLCIDDLSSGYKSNLPVDENLELIIKPVQDIEHNQINEYDGIFHLAAQASVPKSIDDFYESSKNNLLSMLKVWDWGRKWNLPIVYATSSAVYGNLPVGDEAVEKYDILSPYAQDKLTMEHYAQMAWKVYHTRSVGLRFFNVYGPRQDPSNPYSGVISIFIDRLKNNLPVIVNGGYQTRDFIYVKDIVKTLYKSMVLLHNEDKCEVLNVGTGRSVTIDFLLETLSQLMTKKPEVIRQPLPFGDPERSEGIYKKIKDILNIDISEFYTLQKGLEETVTYILNN